MSIAYIRKMVFTAVTCCLTGLSAWSQIVDTLKANELISEGINDTYSFKTNRKYIDIFYLTFRKKVLEEESVCFANPNQKFNETDVKLSKYCDYRLVFIGTTKATGINIILYEEEQGVGIEKNCNVYEVKDKQVIRIVQFLVPRSTRTFKEIKDAIRKKTYTLMYYNQVKQQTSSSSQRFIHESNGNLVVADKIQSGSCLQIYFAKAIKLKPSI